MRRSTRVVQRLGASGPQVSGTGLEARAKTGHEKLLEDYHVFFAHGLETLRHQPYEWFRERLARQVIPQLQTAQNLGFAFPFEYR